MFEKGNQLAKGNHARRRDKEKTLWLLQALQAEGVDLRRLLAKNLLKADKGDKQALEVAHLLAKLLPYVANAPKHDGGVAHIETLVINRIERPAPPASGPVIDVQAVETKGDHPLTSA